jgi:hypothetical protein
MGARGQGIHAASPKARPANAEKPIQPSHSPVCNVKVEAYAICQVLYLVCARYTSQSARTASKARIKSESLGLDKSDGRE